MCIGTLIALSILFLSFVPMTISCSSARNLRATSAVVDPAATYGTRPDREPDFTPFGDATDNSIQPGCATKGQPAGAGNRMDTSTRRDPIAFEDFEGRKRVRKCGGCGQTGHNIGLVPQYPEKWELEKDNEMTMRCMQNCEIRRSLTSACHYFLLWTQPTTTTLKPRRPSAPRPRTNNRASYHIDH
jgi:hypothetical protein